jgi:hypothetical protein
MSLTNIYIQVLLHWTGIQKEEDRIILKTNTKFLMAVAAGLVADAGA